MTTFDDTGSKELEIEVVTQEITRLIKQAEVRLHKFQQQPSQTPTEEKVPARPPPTCIHLTSPPSGPRAYLYQRATYLTINIRLRTSAYAPPYVTTFVQFVNLMLQSNELRYLFLSQLLKLSRY